MKLAGTASGTTTVGRGRGAEQQRRPSGARGRQRSEARKAHGCATLRVTGATETGRLRDWLGPDSGAVSVPSMRTPLSRLSLAVAVAGVGPRISWR